MTLLILGLLLWSAAHFFPRAMPDLRARMGERGRGLVALGSLLAVVLMVIGYRAYDGPVFWGRTPATVGINNLLMLLAVYMFFAAGLKTALARRMRHPMLVSVKIWALAHLLVNGSLGAFVLFGGLMAWAVVEVIVINRTSPKWTPPPPAPARKEIIVIIVALVAYSLISGIHYWLGHPTFG